MEMPSISVPERLRGLMEIKDLKQSDYVKCDFKHTWEALKANTEDGLWVLSNDTYFNVKGYEDSTVLKYKDNLYKKVETPLKWYDNIGEKGVLCWVSDKEDAKGFILPVICYTKTFTYTFLTDSKTGWKYATPLTKAELLEFVGNVEG